MINLIVKHSVFPDSQKIARFLPLHKKGDKSELNNYRPISILTATSKLIEKVLAAQLRLFWRATTFSLMVNTVLEKKEVQHRQYQNLWSNFIQTLMKAK